jgi:tripartite-type tricarboxylate transporter receptor subunit TctC
MRNRRLGLLLVVVAALGLTLIGSSGCSSSAGSAYPSKEVSVVVPWAGGGNTDGIARALIESSKKYLGQNMVVRNIEGGAGTVGVAEVAKAKPDGYTVLQPSSSPFVTVPHLQSVPYKATDNFNAVLRVSSSPILLLVRSDSKFKTLKDLVTAAKEKPGMTYGTPGEGGTVHLAGVKLGLATGTKLKAVPFKVSTETVMQTIGGQIDFGLAEPGPSVQHIAEGRLRALAVFEPDRYSPLPDVPTAKEQGYDVVMNSWTGMAVPKGTPSEVINKLADSFKKGLDEPAFQTAMNGFKNNIAYMNGKDFEALWASEFDLYGGLMQEAGLKKN